MALFCGRCVHWRISRAGATCSQDNRPLCGNKRTLACVNEGWYVHENDALYNLAYFVDGTVDFFVNTTGVYPSTVRVTLFGAKPSARTSMLMGMAAMIGGGLER